MRVVIAGGGVIGCAIAYYLAKAGADVIVLERGDVGQEASSASAGMLIAPFEDLGPRSMVRLQRHSLKLYSRLLDELEDESGIDVEYRRTGLLRTAFTEDRAAALKRLAKSRSRPEFPVQWIEPDEVRKLESQLSDAILGAAFSPKDGHLNSEQLTRAFGRAASRLGADVRRRVALTGFVTHGHKLSGVKTSGGEITGADAIVLAAGPWTKDLAARLSCKVPTRPMRGQMISYRSDRIKHCVWGEDGYLVPKPRGVLFAGSTIEDVGFRKSNTKDGLAHLRSSSGRLVPSLRGLKGTRSWAGLRPGSPDGLPIMGKLPGRNNVFVATGHFRNGILLAPATGQAMCELILKGRAGIPLEPFSPSRFVS